MKRAFLLVFAALLLVVSPTMAWEEHCSFCYEWDCYNGLNPYGMGCETPCEMNGAQYTCGTEPEYSTYHCCTGNSPEDTCPIVCSDDDGCYADPPYGIRNGYGMKCSDSCFLNGFTYTCQVGNGGDCCSNSIWCSECEGLCKSQGTPCQEDPYTSGTCPAPPVPPCPGGGGGGCDCGSQQNGYSVDLYRECVINENYVPNVYVYTPSVQHGHTVSYPDKTEECGENDCEQPYCQDEGWETDPYGWFEDYEYCCDFNFTSGGCGPTYNACPEN